MSERDFQNGFDNLIGGHNEGTDPMLLKQNQYAYGLNISSRGGLISTRPRFKDLEAKLATGRFQGSKRYRTDNGEKLVIGVAGHIYSIDVETLAITAFGKQLNETVDRFFFEQVDRYMVIQDGYVGTTYADSNFPFILNGDIAYDYGNTPEANRIPKGSIMAYGHGRLFVAVNWLKNAENNFEDFGRVNFVAGDIIKAFRPEDVLKFTENEYLSEGGAIKLPSHLGEIGGMKFQRNVQSGTGGGPLLVSGRGGASVYAVNSPRSQWKNIDIGQVLYENIDASGSVSPDSFVTINNDIAYRSLDGIRTFRYSVTVSSSSSAGLHNQPISWEASPSLALDTEDMLNVVTAAFTDNRLFMLNNAYLKDGEKVFRSMIVMDASPVSSITATGNPIYDGVWTGLDFVDMEAACYQNRQRLFIFAKGEKNANHLFILDNDNHYDGRDKKQSRPLCRVYSKYFHFESPFTDKQLKHIELWLSDIIGTVDIKAYARRDNFPYWFELTTGSVCADPKGQPQSRNKKRLTIPKALELPCDTEKKRLDKGTAFQVCIEFTGHAQIDRARLVEGDERKDHKDIICEEETCTVLELKDGMIDLDNFTYEVAI